MVETNTYQPIVTVIRHHLDKNQHFWNLLEYRNQLLFHQSSHCLYKVVHLGGDSVKEAQHALPNLVFTGVCGECNGVLGGTGNLKQ